MKRLLALLVLAAIVAGPAAALGKRPHSQLALLPQTKVSIVTASGTHRFPVWIAADESSRQRGLMYVRSIPSDHGMLFLFDRPHFAAFWMKDTYVSLDIVFIAPGGIVANIAHGTQPLSLAPIESVAPVAGVLELVAGTAARIGLAAGDRVQSPALATP